MLETTTASDWPEVDVMTEELIEATACAHATVVANAAFRLMCYALLALEEQQRNNLVADLPAAVAMAIQSYVEPAWTLQA